MENMPEWLFGRIGFGGKKMVTMIMMMGEKNKYTK